MFRTIGKSKIAFVLAILFGISLLFFRGGSQYSNIFNSDNVAASVSGTTISTSKFVRTLQINVNQFNQMMGKTLTSDEIKAFRIHSLSLGALINDAVFENEYDKKGFKIHEVVIAKRTKERIPKLYDKNNKINNLFLNQFLQQQQLKIEDIVQIIDFETRNQIFSDVFFNVYFPKNFSDKIYNYENHTRKVNVVKVPLELVNIQNNTQLESLNIDNTIKEFYEGNIDQYMSEEKRNIEYIIVNKENYINNFIPSNFQISEYYNDNKDLYFEKEKRSFIQFNFKDLNKAKNFKEEISQLQNANDIIKYANKNNIEFNSFQNLASDEVLTEIANSLFKLEINQKSEIIETPLAKHVIILQNIQPEIQLKLDDVKNIIKDTITNIEIDNYFTELNNNISEKISDGHSLKNISTEFKLEMLNINNLTKNYSNFTKDQQDFYKSLITNAFSVNKDFVNDIVVFDTDQFYIFNVTNVEYAKPLNLEEVRKTVNVDLQKSIKKNQINQQLEKNKTNPYFLKEISSLYNLPTRELVINHNSQELPRNLIAKIFEEKKGSNIQAAENNDIYIVNIADIVVLNKARKEKKLSLTDNIRASFSNELIKNVNISTNDSLINAVIDRY